LTNFSTRSFVRFLAVGVASTGVHYSIMALLYAVLGLPATLASTAGFLVSALANYWLNRTFTFSSTQRHKTAASRFVITASSGLALNYAILHVLMKFDVGVVLAQVSSTVGVVTWNYCIHGVWTFKTAKASGPAR
jgi:putative flippase GtrA